MADSDYSFEGDGSEDEYVGSRTKGTGSGPGPRAQSTSSKRRKKDEPEKAAPRRQAWETEYSRTVEKTIQPADDGTIGQSVQEREEERKRKRLRKDTKPFQRGIIRHVVLVLDLSEAMMEKDMRPNRFITMINYTQDYVREFFEQNPISQMSVLGMHDGSAKRVGIGTGDTIPHPTSRHKRGHRRIWQLIKSGPGRHPHHSQSLQIVTRTNAGDISEYTVATDQEALKELLLATTTPPVVRETKQTGTAPPPESAAALMRMGFPSRVIEDQLTMCACHGNLTLGGYTCSRCSAKVCSLPITCPSCQLTLLLSTHLARSYHHLFPLRNWTTVTWSRAREKGSIECKGCLATFSKPPASTKDRGKERPQENGETNGKNDAEDSEEQKASESGRYECRSCESHFCIDCDMFAHMVLHNCPGCLSRLDPGAFAQHRQSSFPHHQHQSFSPRITSRTMTTSISTPQFQRLIRFKTASGSIKYGDLGGAEVPTLEIAGKEVDVLDGDIKQGFKKSGEKAVVGELLSPLERDTVGIFLCVGLNYRRHAVECGFDIPTMPAIFTKPRDALAGPLDTIPIPPTCQSQLDYEGELTIIISRDCKNVSAADAHHYILGYTVANDVSARNYQLPSSISGGQFGYAKSFDHFAPIGPCIASTSVIPDPQNLHYWTKVNGQVRQETGTDDMVFSVGQIVEHLSRGTTLRAGTAILTGTPSGVGLFREPKGFLADGDVVEVRVEGIGSIVNKMVFEK
ncbi:hypothetical protein T440DRAFT_386166 [Plenodomus tracheiphilus IPT5]|uniref:C2H2-type domain-containing protein n=1 Tax=Plenodomus tracheiphilus IPT5 TaxID=1408161 RepID=A0A6A7BJ64_9PLEO|nr:hypothetical protein T440DRAFT_386166 [Plenodomus tracheiphilus IPT5]